MSYQKITTTNIKGAIRTHWRVEAGGRRWTLTARRYVDADGSQSRAYWDITETTEAANRGDCTITITTDHDDRNPQVKVNWPCKGAQSMQEALRFKKDLGIAIQAATEAEYLIKTEA